MTDSLNIFQKTFREKQEKSKKRLEEFLTEPGEKQIHDLRTAIRRLEVTYLVFPNSFKGDKTDYFVSSYKAFFKKISIIRDLDVIAANLLKNDLTEDSDSMKYLFKQREKKTKDLLKKAKKLSKLKIPSIKNGNNEKIIPKYEKIIFTYIQKIQNYMQIVPSDESKIQELHLMRKMAKKLRYILEIEPNSTYDHLINKMKLFQEILGNIHDNDITIDFLKKNSKKFPELYPIVTKQEETRSRIYRSLSFSLLKE